MTDEIYILSIALAALSISLLAYSRSGKKEESSISIDWEAVMKWAALPTIVIVAVIGYFFVFPAMNNFALNSGIPSYMVDPSVVLLIVAGGGIAAVCGLVATMWQFREPKKATNTQQETEAKTK